MKEEEEEVRKKKGLSLSFSTLFEDRREKRRGRVFVCVL